MTSGTGDWVVIVMSGTGDWVVIVMSGTSDWVVESSDVMYW